MSVFTVNVIYFKIVFSLFLIRTFRIVYNSEILLLIDVILNFTRFRFRVTYKAIFCLDDVNNLSL